MKGDAKVPSISAASILAKTTRDALMCELDGRYPGFSLSGHKGYGTPSHVAALNSLGPSPLHRRSFAPVRIGESFDDAELYQERLAACAGSPAANPPSLARIQASSSSGESGLLMK